LVIVKCHHAIDEAYHQTNEEELCTHCAIELTSKIANELIVHQKATLMYALRPVSFLAGPDGGRINGHVLRAKGGLA
jgi:hypothetical protein